MDQYAAHGAAIAALTSGEERYAGSPMFSALPNAPTVDDAPWWRRLRLTGRPRRWPLEQRRLRRELEGGDAGRARLSRLGRAAASGSR